MTNSKVGSFSAEWYVWLVLFQLRSFAAKHNKRYSEKFWISYEALQEISRGIRLFSEKIYRMRTHQINVIADQFEFLFHYSEAVKTFSLSNEIAILFHLVVHGFTSFSLIIKLIFNGKRSLFNTSCLETPLICQRSSRFWQSVMKFSKAVA